MPSKNEDLLTQIIAGQAKLTEKVDSMNTRLFGGDGQPGILHYFNERHEALNKDVLAVKEKISTDIKIFHEEEVKPLNDKVIELEKETSVTMWKTGAIASASGVGIGAGITILLKRFFGV